MSETPPPPGSRFPLEDQGFGRGWIVLPYLLHTAAGVFSGRVLLLAAMGVILSEVGFWWIVGAPALLAKSIIADSIHPTELAAAAWQTQSAYWLAFLNPFTGANFSPAAVCAGVWRILVWSLFAVAIARIAAKHLTFRERPTASQSLQRSLRGWLGQAGGLLTLLAAVGALTALIWLLGYAARVEFIELLERLTFPIVIGLALFTALLAIGLFVGGPLMLVSQAVERPDPFDAVSCGFAYVYQRPLRLLSYLFQAALIAVVAGALLQLVFLVAENALVAWSLGRGPLGFDSLGKPQESILAPWMAIFAYAPLVFHAAYFWFAATAIYLLMRRDIDEKQTDDIYLEEEPVLSSAIEVSDPEGEPPSSASAAPSEA